MSNFLQVNKDFFRLGLNPTEILVLSQVAEYERTTQDCFMSDKYFAELFGVSDKTISRALKVLEEKDFIKRETKNIQKGKERHIHIQLDKIEQALTKDKKSVVKSNNEVLPKDNLSVVEGTKCPLPKGQNDLIKDKSIKDNIIKDKSNDDVPEVEEITMKDFMEMYNDCLSLVNKNFYETQGILIIYGKKYKIIK